MCFNANKNIINADIVRDETARLNAYWDSVANDDADDFGGRHASVDTSPDWEDTEAENDPPKLAELPENVKKILEECDEFDRAQILAVIEVCRESETLASAGRKLFAQSRQKRVSHNDSDRLKKYLARFGLDWEGVRGEA
jgi:transcriptional regulatory protein RtcR